MILSKVDINIYDFFMGTPTVLAKFIGLVFLVIGLSVMSKKHIVAVLNDLERSPALLWLAGLITVVMGVAIVSVFNVWDYNRHVIITILGWLTLLKGTVIMLFPDFTMSLYKKFKFESFVWGGIIAAVIGIILVYFGFKA